MKILILSLLSSVFLALHPFYVSVTEIKYNAKEQIIEVSCRSFIDDTEKALSKKSNQSIDILHPKNKLKTEEVLSAYLSSNLKIKVNNKPVTLKYIGYEQEEEAIWTYFEIPFTGKIKNIDVENSILYDVETGQMNIVHVEVNGGRKSQKLSNPDKKLIFELD